MTVSVSQVLVEPNYTLETRRALPVDNVSVLSFFLISCPAKVCGE